MTSAHLPRQKGSTGYYSTTVFPDLSHSQITTRFCPPKERVVAMTPLGVITKKYREESQQNVRMVERPCSELKHKAKFFRKAHNVFANKVLLDLEAMKLTRNRRREKIWTRGKKETGFEDLENSMQSTIGTGMIGEKKSLNSFLLRDQPSEQGSNNDNSENMGGDNGDEVFDNFQYADDFDTAEIEQPTLQDSQNDTGFGNFEMSTPTLSTRIPNSVKTLSLDFRPSTTSGGSTTSMGARPSTSVITTPGSAFASTKSTSERIVQIQDEVQYKESKIQSYDNDNRMNTVSTISTGSQFTKKSKNAKSSKRRKKAFNRSTYFECLLDTMDIPAPHVPRFGMMSPSRSCRDRTRVISPNTFEGNALTITSPIQTRTMNEEMTTGSINPDKWDKDSVERARTGDKPRRAKDYS